MGKQEHLHGVFCELGHTNIWNALDDDMHNNLTLQERNNKILHKLIEKGCAIRAEARNYICKM
jgi:hypothetical protein